MLYCDLLIDSVPVWYGVPCLDRVLIKSRLYIQFTGELFFADSQGLQDPEWSALDTRYDLLFFASDGSPAVKIPLQAEPDQDVNVTLEGQNCTLRFYERVLL